MKRGRWQVLLRAFAVQGSWNYETLLGTGFAFVILPALRRLYPGGQALEAAVRRHEGAFNSHPYLAPIALGAVIRMEEEGEDPAVIDRFKLALRGPLGTLGDQMIWAGWRPICVLFALSLLLIGVPWWASLMLFLLVYNIGHFALMVWGFRMGLREGMTVAERLRGTLIRSTQPRLLVAGAFLAGAVVALLVTRGVPTLEMRPGVVWVPLAAVAAVGGGMLGERARLAGAAGLAAVAVAGVVLGVIG